MSAELGQLALILALGLALLQGTLPLWGAQRQQAHWVALARPLALGQFVLVAAALACWCRPSFRWTGRWLT